MKIGMKDLRKSLEKSVDTIKKTDFKGAIDKTVEQVKNVDVKAAVEKSVDTIKNTDYKAMAENAVDTIKNTDYKAMAENTVNTIKNTDYKGEFNKTVNQIKNGIVGINDNPNDELRTISVKNSLQILWYLMMVDGDLNDEEKAQFEEIGKEWDSAYEEDGPAILDEYNKRMKDVIDEGDRIEILKEGISDALTNDPESTIVPKYLLWNLIVMANTDGEYGKQERELIKYYVRRAGIRPSVLLDMESSYTAILEIGQEEDWLKNSDRSYKEIEAALKETQERKDMIFRSVKALLVD